MSDKAKEELSALMDGELTEASAAEAVDVLVSSEELRVQWARYHVVRDVLRHKIYPDAGSVLSERVRASLADEPHHLPGRGLRPRRWRSAIKPVAGMALAASVAAVAILAVRSGDPGPGKTETVAIPSPRVAASAATPTLGTAVPVAAIDMGQGRAIPIRQLHWRTDEPAIAQRLNGYLVSHSEYRGGPMGGLHPYARIVGYDAAEQR